MIISNVVKKEKMREVQSNVLKEIRDSLICSFGPMGTTTQIAKIAQSGDVIMKYSKDGHTILKNIYFNDIIEQGVRTDLEDITRHIVKNVGDGTTSAVILSQIIFERLKSLESTRSPYLLMQDFKAAVNKIKEEIKNNAQEFTNDKAYDIAYISTNGNHEVASSIKSIYEQFGEDVFIDVSISTTEQSYLKSYDGMTLQTGYSDTAYINDSKKGVCSLRNPRVYAFEDPVDTQEMFALFNAIIENNITKAYSDESGNTPVIPTVILAPVVSRDMASYLEQVINFMYSFKDETVKPPFLLISNIYQKEEYVDIIRLCGCKTIKKYINPDKQRDDIEKGLAPTLETVVDFYGKADIVEADVSKTKFVNPLLMHNEDGSLSDTFNTLVQFLEAELNKAYEEGEDNNVTGALKRRINSLKANMVEYLVGGVSMTDRDSLRDLVEDSVLNCRSAARHGVGYGANFEGLLAAYKLKDINDIHNIIFEAYRDLDITLYATSTCSGQATGIVDKNLQMKMPMNIKTKEYDNKVLCSIDTDAVIIDGIAQIVSMMFASNQFLCPTPAHNKYLL